MDCQGRFQWHLPKVLRKLPRGCQVSGVRCQVSGVRLAERVCVSNRKQPRSENRSAGFQTCCIADFQVGCTSAIGSLRVWKPAGQQTWKSALRKSQSAGGENGTVRAKGARISSNSELCSGSCCSTYLLRNPVVCRGSDAAPVGKPAIQQVRKPALRIFRPMARQADVSFAV